MADPRFKTGARPTPRHKLLAAEPFRVAGAPPPQYAVVPKQLSMWGNQTHGDCVSAEEAFAKACYSPEIFIPEATVIAWATRLGYLEGADLMSVMQSMQSDGFVVGAQKYDDGTPAGVDYSSEPTLQGAIAQGPVKLGIASSCLPSSAGNQQGWYDLGPQHNAGMDHCVSLSGYGPAEWLFGQLGVPVPASFKPSQAGYLLFTWSSIGFVDHPWVMAAVGEAWVRNPTTVGVPPLGPPTPPPPVCPPGQHWDVTQQKCVPDTPTPPPTVPLVNVLTFRRPVPSHGLVQFRTANPLAVGAYYMYGPSPTPPVAGAAAAAPCAAECFVEG